MLTFIGFSSPFDNFSGVIRVASMPFLAVNNIKKSNVKNINNTKKTYQVAWYNKGKIKEQQNETITASRQ
jgi:hypothetical protein